MAERLRPFGIISYEQPIAADDCGRPGPPDGHPARRRHGRRVALLGRGRPPADRRRGPARCSTSGSRSAAGRWRRSRSSQIAREAGLACQLGAQVGESGILTAAGRLVAHLADPAFRHHEGADNLFLLRRDLTVENLTARPGGRGDALSRPRASASTSDPGPPRCVDRASGCGRRAGGSRTSLRDHSSEDGEHGPRNDRAPWLQRARLWRWLSDARRFEGAPRRVPRPSANKLLSIVRANRDTAYGREHGFGSIEDIDDYQRNVPINTYESLAPYVERMAAGEPHHTDRRRPR